MKSIEKTLNLSYYKPDDFISVIHQPFLFENWLYTRLYLDFNILLKIFVFALV